MVIKGDEKYISQLSGLWKDVFSDDDEFISIFFDKQYGRCETFCSEQNGKLVSAFYLLPCDIVFDGQSFSGRYLYAAATYPEYRGRALMSCLIKEAQDYCRKNEVDFIALLPAEDSLYGYYERFGFKEAMYRYEAMIKADDMNTAPAEEITDADELKNCRNAYDANRLVFDKHELGYIIESMKNFGARFLKCENCYAVINKQDNEIYEFIGEDIAKIKNFTCLMKGEVKACSPYDLSVFGKSEKKKFGMVYPINKALNNSSDIYMNLGLD